MPTLQPHEYFGMNPYGPVLVTDHSQQPAFSQVSRRNARVQVITYRHRDTRASLTDLAQAFSTVSPAKYNLSTIWLESALDELGSIDADISEDGLPHVDEKVRSEARRVLFALRNQPIAPIVYPTEDAEIAIYFKRRGIPAAVQVLLESSGGGTWSSIVPGHNNNGHCEDSSELPLALLMKALKALGTTDSE